MPGIYTIGGGRQVGKTTLIKQWIAQLIEENIEPARIAYLTGELIDDYHQLVRLLTDALDDMPDMGLNFLILDEASYIRDWDKGVKFLADLTGTPTTVDWNKKVAARLAPLPGLKNMVL